MKYSRLFGKTKRKEKQHSAKSKELLLRAGFIRRIGPGMYSLLPLGFRVQKRLQDLIRCEMEALEGLEVSVPLVNPADLWERTGRSDLIDKDMVHFPDRFGKELVLSPSHEEAMVDLVKNSLNSYRDFPLFLFQFQLKFRDEEKVRNGLIRAREFLMKDAYSFHRSFSDLNNFYPKVFAAYKRIFHQCKLDVIAAESGIGYMGGFKAHEFFIPTKAGDDVVVYCQPCGYYANREIARAIKDTNIENPKNMIKRETEDCFSMKSLSKHLDLPITKLLKPMVYKTRTFFVMAVVRGDYEVSVEKLSQLINTPIVRMASKKELEQLGYIPGFFSPLKRIKKLFVVIDETVANSNNLVAGANEAGYHYLNVNFGRDFEGDMLGDIVRVKNDNICAQCGSPLQQERALELGNIFKLGDFYSKQLRLAFEDENGHFVYPSMGSYGIGVGRLMAAIVEKHHDDKGIIWPEAVSPFLIYLLGIGRSFRVKAVLDELYEKYSPHVLFDDRTESPGVKFKDADLLGIPLRIVVSSHSLQKDEVELYYRRTSETWNVSLSFLEAELKKIFKEL